MQIDQEIINVIKNGGVGVIPTDTIFGLVTSVNFPESIQRIYNIKNRPTDRRCIVLIGNRGQLPALGIVPNSKQLEVLNEFWPGPFSFADLSCDQTLIHLHRGHNCISVRMPAETWLRQMINQTGPIVATSANISGEATPSDIEEIRAKLPGLDFYIDGPVSKEPSKLGKLDENGDIFWLRGV